MIRVLIVAAYASVRAGLQALLAEAEDIAIVGAISGSDELERLLSDDPPNVVLFDDNEGDGVRVLEIMSEREASLVMLGDNRRAYRSLAGSSLHGWAYLLKESDGAEIAGAIRAVAAGLVVLDRSLAPLLTEPAPPAPAGLAAAPAPGEALTTREREVLQLMAGGLPNKQIATRLNISQHTVKFHVASILAKMGATSRTEAVTLAARRGYVTL